MRIFISYSSDERAEALAVQSWLEKNGWENDVFVDVDPEHGLTGGEAWRFSRARGLRRNLAGTSFSSRKSMESPASRSAWMMRSR